MASFSSTRKNFVLLIVSICFFLFLALGGSNAHPLKTCKFDQIYNLGDSTFDTKDLAVEEVLIPSSADGIAYGEETFLKDAEGHSRCSDGLVMNDYLAKASGLPSLLPPYKNVVDGDADFKHGINFAVAGSTALPYEILLANYKRIFSPTNTTTSLGVQLEWLSNHLESICPYNHRDCVEKLQGALFMVESIGGNDYNYALLQGKTIEELKQDMVPEVVDAIIKVVEKVIDLGATRVIVPGSYPAGCLPIYQAAFRSNNDQDYDENGCLKQLNDFSDYHNEHLQRAIDKLRQQKPNAIIVYGDYTIAYQFLLQHAKDEGIPVHCEDYHSYMSWDVVHLTHEAYQVMTYWLLYDFFGKLQCQI